MYRQIYTEGNSNNDVIASGLELPPPVISNPQEAAFNEIPDVAPVQQKQFTNFQPNNNNNRVKVVNGRRALVRKLIMSRFKGRECQALHVSTLHA